MQIQANTFSVMSATYDRVFFILHFPGILSSKSCTVFIKRYGHLLWQAKVHNISSFLLALTCSVGRCGEDSESFGRHYCKVHQNASLHQNVSSPWFGQVVDLTWWRAMNRPLFSALKQFTVSHVHTCTHTLAIQGKSQEWRLSSSLFYPSLRLQSTTHFPESRPHGIQ